LTENPLAKRKEIKHLIPPQPSNFHKIFSNDHFLFYTVPGAAEEAIPAVLELWLAACWLIKHTPKIISE
jgi:hypothetical protein